MLGVYIFGGLIVVFAIGCIIAYFQIEKNKRS